MYVDRLIPLQQPRNQTLQLAVGFGPIHALLSGYRLQDGVAPLIQRDGRAVVGEGLARQVDHGHNKPVDVQRGRDLAADTEQRLQVAGAAFGVVQLSVAEGQSCGRREACD